jgi:hypothetical protein
MVAEEIAGEHGAGSVATAVRERQRAMAARRMRR